MKLIRNKWQVISGVSNGVKFAIIDCDKNFTDTFVLLLQKCLCIIGFTECIFDIYEDSSVFLEKNYQKYDYRLIIMDLYQPGSNGIEVAGKIREYDEETALVFVSSINEYATECYLVNAAYLVLKPVDRAACFKILGRVLQQICSRDWKLHLPDGYICQMSNLSGILRQGNDCRFVMQDGSSHLVGGGDGDALEKIKIIIE